MEYVKLPKCGFPKPKEGLPRGPKRTMAELAEDLGVLPGQLRNAMQRSPIEAPKPTLQLGKRTWYDPSTVRRWLEAVGGLAFVAPKQFISHP